MTTTRPDPRRTAALAALALLLAGCSQDFVPASVVVDRRVLALVAEPPELDGTLPAAAATVRAVEAQPLDPPPLRAGASLERRWSVCPFSLGPSAGYACVLPQCEAALAPDASGAVTVSVAALLAQATACLQAPGTVPPPGLGDGSLPPVTEVLVRYRLVDAAPALPDLVLREAVQRLPVWTQPPTRALNTSPLFDAAGAVRVGGAVADPCPDPTAAGVGGCPVAGTLSAAAALPVEARVEPGSIESYLAGDRQVDETFALSFFTTAGRFVFDTGAATRAAPGAAVELEHKEVPAGTTDALLWVVLRDLRGGEAVAGPYRVAVE